MIVFKKKPKNKKRKKPIYIYQIDADVITSMQRGNNISIKGN